MKAKTLGELITEVCGRDICVGCPIAKQHNCDSLGKYHIEKIEGDPVSYLLKCANQKEAKKSNKDVAFLLMLPFILTVLILCLVGNLFWILFWIELSGCVLLSLWLYALSYDLEEGEGSET